uniref:Uncharacterized protein n=1 Tax=Amphimedon queenslandica TaxID=400682 RepID=A0A1X7UWP2_AMPQE
MLFLLRSVLMLRLRNYSSAAISNLQARTIHIMKKNDEYLIFPGFSERFSQLNIAATYEEMGKPVQDLASVVCLPVSHHVLPTMHILNVLSQAIGEKVKFPHTPKYLAAVRQKVPGNGGYNKTINFVSLLSGYVMDSKAKSVPSYKVVTHTQILIDSSLCILSSVCQILSNTTAMKSYY